MTEMLTSKCFSPLVVMYKYIIDAIAEVELQEAGSAYELYFANIGDYEKGVAWADRFYAEYKEKIETLKENPFLYSPCCVYPFVLIETEYRSFPCGWYTIFYTVDDSSFTVWHIRSSRSDFTSIRIK